MRLCQRIFGLNYCQFFSGSALWHHKTLYRAGLSNIAEDGFAADILWPCWLLSRLLHPFLYYVWCASGSAWGSMIISIMLYVQLIRSYSLNFFCERWQPPWNFLSQCCLRLGFGCNQQGQITTKAEEILSAQYFNQEKWPARETWFWAEKGPSSLIDLCSKDGTGSS